MCPAHAEPDLQRFLVAEALQDHAGVKEEQRRATEVRDEPEPAAAGPCGSPAPAAAGWDGRNKRLINGDRWTSISDCCMKPPR